MQYQLSIIVPTKNEEHNIELLINKLFNVCSNIHFEIIFVDDSSDNTCKVIQKFQNQYDNIQLIHRDNATGLSSAVIVGMGNVNSDYICVMDADLQHDEAIIPTMLNIAEIDKKNIVIATRYNQAGNLSAFSPIRKCISYIATQLAEFLLPIKVSDPMSGFFLIHREVYLSARDKLSGIGFKILLDLIFSSDIKLHYSEVSYKFGKREFGKSKLNFEVILDYLLLLIYHKLHIHIPKTYIYFAICGAIGAIIHYITFMIQFLYFDLPIFNAHVVSAFMAILVNYNLNNFITFKKKRGVKSPAKSFIAFLIISLFGILISGSITEKLYNLSGLWLLASVFGVIMASVWNYVLSKIIIWNKN